jgi:hypothetical protein
MKRPISLIVTISALSLAAATTAWGQENGGASASAETFVGCFGGIQEFVNGGTQNAPVASAAAAAILPFSTFAAGAAGPAGDADLYVVTLSGEADNTAAGGGFTVQAQASVNGGAFFDLSPDGPNTFLQSTVAETNTATWCRRLTATNSVVIRILWNHFGAGSSILDDYTVLVHRSN